MTNYERKVRKLKKAIKNLVVENSSLCDICVETQNEIDIVKQEREFLARKLLEFEPTAAEFLQTPETRPYNKKRKNSSESDLNKPMKKKEKIQQSLLKKQVVVNQQPTVPKTPVIIDGVTIHCFGRIVTMPAFYNDTVVYPVSYKISRLFMNKMFVCHIKVTNNGQAPLFEISLASSPQNFTFAGPTTNDVHAEVLHVFNNNVGNIAVDGDGFFGLKNKRIKDFINMLPNAKKLIKIKQENFDEMIIYDDNARYM